jgi:hypothetical protein
LAVQSSPTPFLRSDHSLVAHHQRVRSASAGDLFRLVANDRRNPKLEFFNGFDWALLLQLLNSAIRQTAWEDQKMTAPHDVPPLSEGRLFSPRTGEEYRPKKRPSNKNNAPASIETTGRVERLRFFEDSIYCALWLSCAMKRRLSATTCRSTSKSKVGEFLSMNFCRASWAFFASDVILAFFGQSDGIVITPF